MIWTPITECLPPQDVEVLATTTWGDVTIAERIGANRWFIYEGNANATTDDILAWSSLPEPYKKGEK